MIRWQWRVSAAELAGAIVGVTGLDRGRYLGASGELSELERGALAHALAGWSTGEAARRLGLPRRSTDNALQRAKRKLNGWQQR